MSDVDNTRRTAWVCKVSADHTVRLEDIPARQLTELETMLSVTWLDLVVRPLADSRGAIAMYEKCCFLSGVQPRELTVRELVDVYELVPDDLPETYTEGLPDPKADEAATAG